MILAILITFVIVYLYAKSDEKAHLQHIAFSLIVGGALGNVIDRIQHGFVVDFVHLRLPDVISNVSNLADHAIVLGVIVLLIENFVSERDQKKQAETMPQTEQEIS